MHFYDAHFHQLILPYDVLLQRLLKVQLHSLFLFHPIAFEVTTKELGSWLDRLDLFIAQVEVLMPKR